MWPIKHSPPGSSVHGALQARILEWVAIPFSGDLPNPGIKLTSPALAHSFFTTEPPGKPMCEIDWPKDIHETSICWVSPMFSCSVASGSLQPHVCSTPVFPDLHYLPGCLLWAKLFPCASVTPNKEKNPSTLFISLPLRKGRWLGWDSHNPTNSQWKRKIRPRKATCLSHGPSHEQRHLGAAFSPRIIKREEAPEK